MVTFFQIWAYLGIYRAHWTTILPFSSFVNLLLSVRTLIPTFCRPISTNFDQFRPISTNFDQFRPILTSMDRFRSKCRYHCLLPLSVTTVCLYIPPPALGLFIHPLLRTTACFRVINPPPASYHLAYLRVIWVVDSLGLLA